MIPGIRRATAVAAAQMQRVAHNYVVLAGFSFKTCVGMTVEAGEAVTGHVQYMGATITPH